MLCIGTAMFGLFFFLTLFTQTVLGYSAVRSGVAYLPFAAGIVTAAGLASRLIPRVGARPLIVAGAAAAAGGMFWFSRLTEHAGYPGQLLGPMLVTSFGLGLLFVPLSLVALHNVAEQDSGVAASLLNTGQQVGGAIGLAALGTIAWTTVANNLRNASAAIAAGRQPPASPAQLASHALASGFARGFLAAAGIALLALLIALATIRVRRQDLTGVRPAPDEEAAPQPVAVRRHEDRAALAAAVRPCRHC
jgi:MFS family permease